MTQWISLYLSGKIVTYFHRFGDEYIPNQIKKGTTMLQQTFVKYKQMVQKRVDTFLLDLLIL